MPRCFRLAFLLLCLLLCAPALAADELRVLIDVSGSMKQNDPLNLRAPALRMLINLLPPDSRAGIWYFEQDVETPVPPAAVTPTWREQALSASYAVHSRGQLTDIGGALEAASGSWLNGDASERRSLLLLTDGMVDISRTPGANEAGRAELLQELLPQLQRAGIAVHTVALSEQADHDLLERLAVDTGGRFEIAHDADELERIFLRMFEQSVERDTLPLHDNRFNVDAGIEEFTLLAFRRAGSAPAVLQTPSGDHVTADTAYDTVRWHQERGYDLVTVSTPEPGEWRLLADIDPDNRVMIVTDLKLEVAPTPSHLFAGEALELKAALTEHGKVIDRADFLAMTRLSATGAEGLSHPFLDDGIAPDEHAGDGSYSLQWVDGLSPGQQMLRIRVDGHTFEREVRRPLEVAAAPVRAELSALPAAGGHRILLTPAVAWIEPKSLSAQLRLAPLDVTYYAARSETGELLWDVAAHAAMQSAHISVTGRTTSGRAFSTELAPLEIPALAPPPAPEPAQDVNWLIVIGMLTIANLALFGIIAVSYLLYRERRPSPPGFPSAPNAPDEVPV